METLYRGYNSDTGKIETVSKHGPTLSHALLSEAQREHEALVDAAAKHPAPDGRRVLTSEHCALRSAIDGYRRHGNHANLRAVIDEAKRTRGLWE